MTITGYSRAEWSGRRIVFSARDSASGALVGAALVHRLIGGWSEVAVLFVREPHRGVGTGAGLLAEVVRQLPSDRLLLYFCEDRMARLATEAGFTVHADPSDITRRSWADRVFFSILYPLQWRADAYRRSEMRRKRERYGCSFDFSLATLDRRDHPITKDLP
ncbi:hypothetical protein GSU68_08745 [Rathayibacter sp. VKM Ac-2759]|uniref:hypothetical protein n=1 Tax=Rathayibacter sp. VKM Ac-2759 TaxID=2609252 RepID=UPI0013166702|nr:hypothetical protein [Rathayibacter sp. VKM Ac-2759]QHC66649.1 hypothetical protein GSU68_08745 [Rathayibacter sp. VKM Ac-2759]